MLKTEIQLTQNENTSDRYSSFGNMVPTQKVQTEMTHKMIAEMTVLNGN